MEVSDQEDQEPVPVKRDVKGKGKAKVIDLSEFDSLISAVTMFADQGVGISQLSMRKKMMLSCLLLLYLSRN